MIIVNFEKLSEKGIELRSTISWGQATGDGRYKIKAGSF